MTISFDDAVQAQAIPELMIARRAFPVAQELLAAPVIRRVAAGAEVGWFDTEVCAETGSIAVVSPLGPLAGLVGDIVVVKRRLPSELRGVFAYVLATAVVPEDIALSRRCFLELGLPSLEDLTCTVEVVT